MSNTQKFITLVAKMRDAQREAKENPTRANVKAAEDLEYKVDEFILRNIAEQINFFTWAESCKTDETPGAYNVMHAKKEEQEVEP